MATKQSLLFMPDISGFTEFVNQTEISHSQHIISELLEIIIDCNELGLEISEIEGDAILFYKEATIPDADQIIDQAKKMFLGFHTHLKKYESQRICQCGACSTAASLSLKFIGLFGDFGFIHVKDRKKPHGSDVILLHRLLKNKINEKEYLLLSGTDEQRPKAKYLATEYEGFGKIDYHYFSFAPLLKLVEAPKEPETRNRIKNPIIVSGLIKCDRHSIYEVISNLDYRLLWNKKIKKINYKKGRVNRLGTKHTCLVSGKNLEFETVTSNFGANKLVYGERVSDMPMVKEFTIYNILAKDKKGTRLTIELHYIPLPVIGRLILPLFKFMFKRNLIANLAAIRDVCEN